MFKAFFACSSVNLHISALSTNFYRRSCIVNRHLAQSLVVWEQLAEADQSNAKTESWESLRF